ncbi:hypothetical protein H0H92_000930 [Tricholoma furcatifolium]|nr:hypothetical protein H0H92_000930 [Tricholoma furcatifolium]
MLPVSIQRKIIDACPGDCTHPSYFIKYRQEGLLGEFRNLKYLSNLAKNAPNTPRIPEAVDYFDNRREIWGTDYLVMEYIPPPAVTLQKWITAGTSDQERQDRVDVAVSKVTEAISWLTSCLALVAALERYVNDALTLYADPEIDGPPRVIKLTDLPLQFCHTDVTYDNFLIDPDTLQLSLIDANSFSILPSPFVEFALTLNRFSKAVLARLPIEYIPEVGLLYSASGKVTQNSRPDLCE